MNTIMLFGKRSLRISSRWSLLPLLQCNGADNLNLSLEVVSSWMGRSFAHIWNGYFTRTYSAISNYTNLHYYMHSAPSLQWTAARTRNHWGSYENKRTISSHWVFPYVRGSSYIYVCADTSDWSNLVSVTIFCIRMSVWRFASFSEKLSESFAHNGRRVYVVDCIISVLYIVALVHVICN